MFDTSAVDAVVVFAAFVVSFSAAAAAAAETSCESAFADSRIYLNASVNGSFADSYRNSFRLRR